MNMTHALDIPGWETHPMRSIVLKEKSWGEHLVRSTYLRMKDHPVSARFSTVKPQRYKPILYSKANHDGLFISSDLWIGNLFSKFILQA